jgi:hypothetical protein
MENLLSGTITILACCEGNAELPQRSLDHKTSSPVPVKVRMGIPTGAFQPTGQPQKISMQVMPH